MKTILLEEAKTELKKIADANPDRVAKCKYEYLDNEGNMQHCMIGEYLTFLGIRVALLDCPGNTDIKSVRGILEEKGLFIEDEALDFMAEIQSQQDGGLPWGKAYEMAIEKQ